MYAVNHGIFLCHQTPSCCVRDASQSLLKLVVAWTWCLLASGLSVASCPQFEPSQAPPSQPPFPPPSQSPRSQDATEATALPAPFTLSALLQSPVLNALITKSKIFVHIFRKKWETGKGLDLKGSILPCPS